ncbi:MAG: DNA-formamidopyrimidine glycosylase family protein [Corynebacterium sp.]|nr:DNA-formamidopyrimidine glycosylase family protein [Corynebacterium sp.]
MPEGDSVFRLSERLQPLVGRTVVRTQFRVPQYANVSLDGAELRWIWPYGKHLFMLFGQTVLHTHLKMEGSWSMHRKGERWPKPGYKARVVLDFSGGVELVGFELGFVRMFPIERYDDRVSHLGPDLLAEVWDAAEAKKRLLAKPERPIGTALLDQRNLAGIGNEYRMEICFICGVHPATPVSSVDIDAVLKVARKLMWANRRSPIRVTTGIRRRGQNAYVFGRSRRPCRRCGTVIQQGSLGGPDLGGEDDELERIIWWCPKCQPL